MNTSAREIPGLEAARLAPSAHNTQPWRFRKENGLVRIGWDPHRELPAGDPRSRYLLTGLGAATESMALGAAQVGLSAEVSFALSPSAREVATLDFSPGLGSSTDLALAKAIPRRQTTRLPFYNDPIPIGVVDELMHEGEINGCSLAVITGRSKVRRLARNLVEGTRRNFEELKVYKEFFGWLRLNHNDPRYQQDGLTLESLSLGFPSSMIAPWILPPTSLAVLKAVRLHFLLARTQGRLADQSPAICLLVAKSHTLHDLFLGGRTMLRVWLAATNLGLRVHPITAMMDHDETRIDLADLFGISQDSSMVVCFRVGFGPISPRSPRLPVKELVVS